jgi:hypothetical protein
MAAVVGDHVTSIFRRAYPEKLTHLQNDLRLVVDVHIMWSAGQ